MDNNLGLKFFETKSLVNSHLLEILVPFIIVVVCIFPVAYVYRKYLRTTFLRAICISSIAIIIGFAIVFSKNLYHEYYFKTNILDNDRYIIPLFFSGLLALFLVPFAINLYNKWIGNDLTDVERKPGAEGVRAWLSVGNLVCCFGIALCSWIGFNYSFISLLVVSLCAVLAYPMLNNYSQNTEPERPVFYEDLSKEREKILSLLEQGKITAEECAELLNALAASSYPPRND